MKETHIVTIEHESYIQGVLRTFLLDVEVVIGSQQPSYSDASSDDYNGFSEVLSCEIEQCVEVLENGEEQLCMAGMVGFSRADWKEISMAAYQKIVGE